MHVQPYLVFDGRCEEAIEFYRRAAGAEVEMLAHFRDMPEPREAGMIAPGTEDKVMHAALRIGDSMVLVSDGRCGGAPSFQGFSLSVETKDEEEADRLFHALADGGIVQMPMGETFFARRFGMLVDRFGVAWMVIVRA